MENFDNKVMDKQVPKEASTADIISTLPICINNNPRHKFNAEKVSLTFLTNGLKRHKGKLRNGGKESEGPVPLYPLQIDYFPDKFSFEVNDEVVIRKLRIWNPCSRFVYVKCCGLWDESARLCASWYCYPKTRFLLAPGLGASIIIKVVPRGDSVIPFAHVGLQLAAAYLRDNVVGYFVVPIFVKFMNYVPPSVFAE
ncbi:unnamed protein product [Leptidea sinapis]|uniref:Uncharacterized protein n=1 Tax=Leptidea sinapis TaxID=189913 RepID=A0A5E4Q305_9NEOP|nr:unnamed protein product [Leptidea sinapis]